MSDGKKRIKIIFHPDGRITAATEGMHGTECVPYMDLLFTALDAVPEVPPEKAMELLSPDYFNCEDSSQEEERMRMQQKQYVQVG